jgi:hypothetical protein
MYPEASFDESYLRNSNNSSQGSYQNLNMSYTNQRDADQYVINPRSSRTPKLNPSPRNCTPEDYSPNSSFSDEYANQCYTNQPHQQPRPAHPCYTGNHHQAQGYTNAPPMMAPGGQQPHPSNKYQNCMSYNQECGATTDRTATPIPMFFNPMSDFYQDQNVTKSNLNSEME